jgi:hypothetical protein
MPPQVSPVPTEEIPWRDIFARYERALNEIEQRKSRITSALAGATVPYALVGGQAVIAWVSTVDPAAVRTTKDVDILLRREDLPRAKQAAAAAGFDYFEIMGVGMFLERDDPNPKKAVHIVWAGQFVKPGEPLPAPSIDAAAILGQGESVVSLEWLVKMKLTAWRLHDQVHLRDLLDVGLIDASWCERLPPELAARLQHLIDTPGG